MSVFITGRIFWSRYEGISYTDKKNKVTKVAPATAKLVMLAIGDSADDFGENSFQSFETIASKASIKRRSAIRVVRGLIENGYLSIKGISRYGTNNFSINMEKLGSPPQKRAQIGRPKNTETSDLESPISETSDSETKIGDSETKNSDLESPDPSFNHPITISAQAEKKSRTNPNTGRNTDAKVQGDLMDGLLWGKKLADEIDSAMADAINAYPSDCHTTLKTLIAHFNWQAFSIPQTGSTFAQWIKEIREINKQVGKFGQDAVKAACKASKDLTVSHPASITWAINGEVGKLAMKRKTQGSQTTQPIETPFTKSLASTDEPLSEDSLKAMEATKNKLKILNS